MSEPPDQNSLEVNQSADHANQVNQFGLVYGDVTIYYTSQEEQEAAERRHRTYLRSLFDRYGYISLANLLDETPRDRVSLFEVYVPLFLGLNIWVEGREKALVDWWIQPTDAQGKQVRPPREFAEQEQRPKHIPSIKADPERLAQIVQRTHDFALELLEKGSDLNGEHSLWRFESEEIAAVSDRLVITGDPGSGKSTLLRHLALCLAEANLPADDPSADEAAPRGVARLGFWPLPAYTPVFVELRALVQHAFPDLRDEVNLAKFLDYLEAKQLADCGCQAYRPTLEKQLEAGGAILFLDGLDEVPLAADPDRRAQIKRLAALLVTHYGKCRIVVTSRPYAYAGDWQLEDFGQVKLAALDYDRLEELALRLFRVVLGAEKAEEDAAAFKAQMERVDEELRRSPLFFTLLAALWINNRTQSPEQRLPLSKGGIYRACVELMLRRWARKDLGPQDGESLEEATGVSTGELRTILENLAFQVHGQAGGGDGPAEFSEGDVLDAIRAAIGRRRGVDVFALVDHLAQRAGVLYEFDPAGRYRFAHLSFQEHLAACCLARREHYPALALDLVRQDPTRWRNVLDLLPDEVLLRDDVALWDLVEAVLDPDVPEPPPHGGDPQWATVALAARVLLTCLHDERGRLARVMRQQCAAWLVALLEVGALAPVDRAEMGRYLAALGDPRPGVMQVDARGLPVFDWCEVPGGPFLLGSTDADEQANDNEKPPITVDVPTFYLGRYPVTNAQFQAFLDDPAGYNNPAWWTEAGLAWKGERTAPDESDDPDFRLPNHPRIYVCWYEAYAYCGWLNARLGSKLRRRYGVGAEWTVRLPSEVEWEKGARGVDGRIYPYGDRFEANKGNTRETGIGQTSAVGLFADPALPYGLLDMSGNVWEWCQTKYPFWDYAAGPETMDNTSEGNDHRVLRGGSWNHFPLLARAAFRDWYFPVYGNYLIGFRVCFGGPHLYVLATRSVAPDR